jgi:hypothetical protein
MSIGAASLFLVLSIIKYTIKSSLSAKSGGMMTRHWPKGEYNSSELNTVKITPLSRDDSLG